MLIVYSRNWPLGPLPKSVPSQIVYRGFSFQEREPKVFETFLHHSV